MEPCFGNIFFVLASKLDDIFAFIRAIATKFFPSLAFFRLLIVFLGSVFSGFRFQIYKRGTKMNEIHADL